MPVDLTRFVRNDFANSEEVATVTRIANELLAHLQSQQAQVQIAAANQPRASSAKIQDVFLAFARELGFVDERKGLFATYESAVRPDYYYSLESTGILLEVERGKTTINNMDFLDFWKCHLCEHAHYLFLMVPKELRQNPKMVPRHEYTSVVRRLKTFFVPRNYTNVRGLFVFGY